MGFSSRSSNGRRYKSGHHGSDYYQKKGFMRKLFDMIGSGGFSGSNHKHHNNNPIYNEPLPTKNTITCRKCNSQIPEGSKFCLQCGEKVDESLFCPNCGEKLPQNAKFCLGCGTKLSK